jgi:hypothetical protein
MGSDLQSLGGNALFADLKRLRDAIRELRCASGQKLCWRHPKLWALLPESIIPDIEVLQ